jgi:methionine sulfoxide reductase heme-binding subunit
VSHAYKAVGWNRQKKLYDLRLAAGVWLYLATFAGLTLLTHPEVTVETVVIRATGTCALALLHIVLCIGPLARLDARFLPLLYNRRHLGVTMFLLGLTHAVFCIVQFHSLGDVNPLVSVLAGNTRYGSVSQFPFEVFGVFALVVLFLMAATSHDFWLANLTAPVWKSLHMAVYAAYASLILHVATGVLQAETNPLYTGILALGLVTVLGLHAAAAWRGRAPDRERGGAEWVDVCHVSDILDRRARTACLGGERVAVFRYDGRISALSAVCQHQNGPLGEGCIVDGLVTCPWHGYQYRPEDGTSPPPFTEKVPTFRVKVENGRVLVDPRPLPPGTRVEPAFVPEGMAEADSSGASSFYVGYRKVMPAPLADFLRPWLLAVAVAVPILAAGLAIPQMPFGPGAYEFGRSRSFEGLVLGSAYPTLLLGSPLPDLDAAAPSRCLLVAPGKHGAAELMEAFDGQRVRLEGTLILRDRRRMIEVVPGTIVSEGTAAAGAPPRRLGRFTLRGEIVDSKCYLGVMKPGNLKPHKACAIRCISGGIPPVFVVRDGEGRALYLLLEDLEGRAVNRRVLDFVAEPLEIEGEVEQRDDLYVLRADPAAYRRLP